MLWIRRVGYERFSYNAYFEINASCSEASTMNQSVREGARCCCASYRYKAPLVHEASQDMAYRNHFGRVIEVLYVAPD